MIYFAVLKCNITIKIKEIDRGLLHYTPLFLSIYSITTHSLAFRGNTVCGH